MANLFYTLRPLSIQTRTNFLSLLDTLSLNELNTIPIGFNNNIVWNIAHAVATMDILYYSLSGLSPVLDNEFLTDYRKGSSPKTMVGSDFVDSLKIEILAQLDRIEADTAKGIFPEMLPKPYTTSFHYELKSFDDIVQFNLVHESLHLGMVMSLKKFV